MKKLLSHLFLFTFLGLIFISCSDDDDDAAAPATIIGAWEAIDSDVDVSMKMNGQELDQTLVEQLLLLVGIDTEILDEDDNSIIEFDEDGTYMITDDSGSDSGTYSLSSDGKTITIDNEIEFNIVSLTATAMSIEAIIMEAFEEEGDAYEITLDLDASFRKVQ